MRTVLGLIFLMCLNASASMTLTVSNPDQTVAAGGHAVYKGTLSNTDAVAYTVVTFTAINPPADATTPPGQAVGV